MKRWAIILLTVLSASAARADLIDYIRAIVGNAVITRQQVARSAAADVESQGLDTPGTSDSVLQRIYNDTYQAMLRHNIILQDFKRMEKEKHAKIPENIIDEEVDRRIKTRFGGDRVRFDKWLEANGMTRLKFRQDARDDIIDEIMRHEFVPQPIISPLKIEQYYADHQDKYSVPERVKFRWIVKDKQPDDTNGTVRGRVENILQLARAGSDFGDLANTPDYSDSPQRPPDWLEIDKVNEAYRSELSKIKPGECTGIIETERAYYILHLDAREPAHLAPLNEVRGSIADDLKKQEWNRRYDAWINKLRNKVSIQEF